MRRRRHARRWDDPFIYSGMVYFHGQLWDIEAVQNNARDIMAGFDELPRRVRDIINYAKTPEGGSRATREIVTELIEKSLRRRRR